MRILVAAVGRLRTGPEADLVNDYASRIRAGGRSVGLTRFDLVEVEATRGLEGVKRQERESAQLLEEARGASLVALDERGDMMSSEAFAGWIARKRDSGCAAAAFLVGGADGHHPSLAARAELSIAFGRATFPHMLVRVMLVEQIYRAVTILSGHPYHRA
jgi:23S rRNA (pseudouridine1915-N3)-methyltransferase